MPSLSWTLLRLAIASGLALPLFACSGAPPAALATTPTFTVKSGPTKSSRGAVVIGLTNAHTKIASGPAPPQTAPSTTPELPPPELKLTGPSETLTLEQVTLPAFADEVFAKTLGLTAQIGPAVMHRTDLVTLRTGKPLPAKELFTMAKKVLASYGIGVSWDGSVLHIETDEHLMAQMPELIRGRALPEVPAALRPIFEVINLHQVSVADMVQWLTNAFGNNVKIVASAHNALMIFGLPRKVRAAVEAVRVLDQAHLAGRESLRISPVYWTAQDLANKLVEVLRAEGYDATATGVAEASPAAAITFVPVAANNSLIAFAADPKVLAHIRHWVTDLDQPGQVDPTHNIFIYSVQNTTAASLGRTVEAVLGGPAPVSAPAEAQLEQAGRTQALPQHGETGQGISQTSAPTQPELHPRPAAPPQSSRAPPSSRAGATPSRPRIVIDNARNDLVLIGSAQDYERIRPLLLALDKAPREALIEVTAVEVDLDNANNLGVEWTLLNHIGNGLSQRLGTGSNVLLPPSSSSSNQGAGGLSLGTSGFNYTIFNNISDVRLLLNAFAQDNRLSVLSTPRVLAESGQTAHIEVGTEVPIVTSQGTTNTIQNAGTTGILQSIEYRKTGVLLAVRPVVHSGDRIDLAVNQEVSQALPNNTPGISSPLIQNRNISTQLTLSDGQTVVIGGLIAENRTANNTGVPFLKDIPGLGLLFRNQSVSKTRTELLVFITPYVISSGTDAAEITRQFRNQLKTWPIPSTKLHW